MALYRPGGLNLTQRFDHTKVMDLPVFQNRTIYDIDMSQGLCRQTFRLRLRRFAPRVTDVVHRKYMDINGRVVMQDAGAFCLADVEATANDFGEYIDRNALEGLTEAVKNSDPIVMDVFGMIAKRCGLFPVRRPGTNLSMPSMQLLKSL